MLEFTCSTCGKRVLGNDSLAGRTVLCSEHHMFAVLLPTHAVESAANLARTPQTALPDSVPTEGSYRDGGPDRGAVSPE